MFLDTRAVTARLLLMVNIAPFFITATEHMDISNLTGKRLKCIKQSTVSTDLIIFLFIQQTLIKFRDLIKESLLIKHDEPQLNKAIESFPLNLFD